MESHLTEEAAWAGGLASRLRLIQANFADDPPATRQEYIAEEIDRALKGVVPSKKKIYLATLGEKFPSWEGTRSPPASDDMAGPAPLTIEELLARLMEAAPRLSPEARVDFAKKLQTVGLGIKESADAFLELPPDLQKKLAIPPGKPLSLERAVKLLAASTDLAVALDQLVWALWKQIAPRSNIRKESDFARLAGQYLGGDPEVSTQQLTQPLEKTRRLIAGLLGAVGRAGANFSKKHVARFAPEAIQDLAEMEKKMLESREQACWRKYVQLAKEHGSEPAIENEIQEAIAKAAENLIMGRAAG